QADGGIRDRNVTGVQTCALPISFSGVRSRSGRRGALGDVEDDAAAADGQFVGHGADLGRDVGVAGGPVAGAVADDGIHPRRDAEAVEVGLVRAQSGAARRIVGGRDVGYDEVD